MSEIGKRGSSRRKGDEYQDVTALRLALEAYINRKPFELYLEYEKSGNLDEPTLIRLLNPDFQTSGSGSSV